MSSTARRGRTVLLCCALAATACGRGEPPRGEPAPAAPPSLQCRGNEPFWSLQIDGAGAIYRALGAANPERRFAGGFAPQESRKPVVLRWDGAAQDDPAARLVATIRRERCLDTMSDETPPFSYAITLEPPEGGTVTGCCRSAEVADGERA